jgi:hypothetical protein
MLTTSNHITFPTVTNTAPVISRIGTDDVFCELSFRRLGDETIELVCTRVEYSAYTDRYLRDELGREVVSEEDAENVAVDLEWLAVENLDATDDRGVADPCGFGEAVERELAATAKEDRDNYMRHAIAHNAALIAAE